MDTEKEGGTLGTTTKKGKLKRKPLMEIELPFPLPTWNRVLAMNRWGRAKLRHWLHDSVGMVLRGERITGKLLESYYGLIRPKTRVANKKKVKRKARRKRVG